MANARSELVPSGGMKTWVFLGVTQEQSITLEASSHSASPSADVWLYPRSACCQWKSPAKMAGAGTSGTGVGSQR